MSKLLTELNNPFNACAHKQHCIDRIAELEAESESRYKLNKSCLNRIAKLEQDKQRLRDALIPVPDEMSLSQIEAWLSRYEVKRKKALEDS